MPTATARAIKSNLQQSDDGEANRYLLACLLSFYQQLRLYEDKGGQWRDFNIARHLRVFLGKTVTGGKSAGKAATETGVVRIIRFPAWALHDRQVVVAIIEELLSGKRLVFNRLPRRSIPISFFGSKIQKGRIFCS